MERLLDDRKHLVTRKPLVQIFRLIKILLYSIHSLSYYRRDGNFINFNTLFLIHTMSIFVTKYFVCIICYGLLHFKN